MLALAQGNYSGQQIKDILHGRVGSREVSFRFALANAYDVEIGTLSSVSGGRISLNTQAEISRTAQFEMSESEALHIDWLSDRIKPFMRVKLPDGTWAEWPLGVFLLSSPSRKDTNGGIVRAVEAYDKSLILLEDRFADRYLIASGTAYTAAVKTIIEAAGIWKTNITTSAATLAVAKEFEIGTTKLEAINMLLAGINYLPLYIDADGYAVGAPYSVPTLREVDYSYETDDLSLILPGATQEEDLFSVPNKWVVVASNPEKAALVSTFTNTSASSPTSTVNRKRTIVDFRSIDDIFDQTTLDAYTQRIAYEASHIYGRCTFITAQMPHHGYSDILYIGHTDLSIEAKYTEMAWTLDLSPSGSMSHDCRKVITI